jgi:hypothetical protein
MAFATRSAFSGSRLGSSAPQTSRRAVIMAAKEGIHPKWYSDAKVGRKTLRRPEGASRRAGGGPRRLRTLPARSASRGVAAGPRGCLATAGHGHSQPDQHGGLQTIRRTRVEATSEGLQAATAAQSGSSAEAVWQSSAEAVRVLR